MIKTLILGYIALLGIDLFIVADLRRLVYSFLLTKRNVKGAKKIHLSQTKKDRFTLSYVEQYAVYKEDFRFYRKFLKIYAATLLPQFAAIAVVNCISVPAAIIVLLLLIHIKLVFYFVLHISKFSSASITKYDRRYLLRKKRGK